MNKKYNKPHYNGCSKCAAELLVSEINFDYNSLPLPPAGYSIRLGDEEYCLCPSCYRQYLTFKEHNFKINRTDFLYYPLHVISNIMGLTEVERSDYCLPSCHDIHMPVIDWRCERIHIGCSSCFEASYIKCVINYNAEQDKYLMLCSECTSHITSGYNFMLENWLNEADTRTDSQAGEIPAKTVPDASNKGD